MSDRRLHPAAILVSFTEEVGRLVAPVAAGVLLGAGGGADRAVLFGLAGVAASVLVAALRWRSTRYRVTPEGVRVVTGVVSPDETALAAGRIGGVDVVRGPLQRLFGVVELQLQTPGGGGEPEVRLVAVTPAEAARVAEVLGHRLEVPPEPAYRLGGGRLLAAALTAPQLGVVLSVAGGLVAAVQGAFEPEDAGMLAGLAPEDAAGWVLLVGGALTVALVLAVLAAVVAFAGFEAAREGDRLRVRRGLLQRRAASLPAARVHAVRVVEGPLRQPFGLVAVRLETAGYRAGTSAATTLLPLARRAELHGLLQALVPELAAEDVALEPPPGRARRRYVLGGALAGVPLAGALAWLAPALAPLPLAAGAALGLLRFADAGWAGDASRLVVRERRLARHTLVADARRLQDLRLRRTPFQRRAGLAHLRVRVGSGRSGRLAHLDAARAAELVSASR